MSTPAYGEECGKTCGTCAWFFPFQINLNDKLPKKPAESDYEKTTVRFVSKKFLWWKWIKD